MDLDNAEEIVTEPEVDEAEQVEPIVEAVDDDQSEATLDDETETVITFGDDEPPEDNEVEASPSNKAFIKMRQEKRELSRELEALKEAQAKPDDKLSQLRARPQLSDKGTDYNEDKHAKDLDDWYGEKAAHDKAKAAKEAEVAEVAEQANAWQARLGEYNDAKAAFKPDTIEDAEALARESLSETQQGVLIEALGKGAAVLLVGLAANERRLKALASIKNPIRFAAEVARLESSMKTSIRRPTTVPETRVAGSGSAQLGNKTLEKLEAEADKTGDRTKVLAFKREQKRANK